MVSGDQLKNRIAVVTGASSGIGRATAIAMAKQGARIALVARNVDKLNETAEKVHQFGGETLIYPADITHRDEVERAMKDVLHRWGYIDILVANAGQYIRSPIKNLDMTAMVRSMDINFWGQLYAILAVLPHMLQRKKGHIIIVATVDAKKGLPLDAPYVAAKFAMSGFADVFRQELHGSGVRVTTIFPGRVDTPMIEHLKVPWISAKISAERVAEAIVKCIFKNKAEVIIPTQAKALCYLQTFSPQFADWIVRVFHLEGWEG